MRTAICLHSGGFTSRQWKRLRDVLAPTHHVITPDFIGYGARERWQDGAPFHYQQDVDEVVALVDQHGDVDLVGHSYGGFVACHVARARPAQVRAMAVYEPVVFSVLTDADADARAQLAHLNMTWPADHPDAWLGAFVDWWNGPGAWDALPDVTKNDFRRTGWKVFEEVRTLAADPTGAGFAAITARTLVMTGGRSPLAAQRTCERLAALLPHATLRRFDGVGHMAPITHHALVDGAIAEHLRDGDSR